MIALFAALGFAISRGTQTGISGMTKQQTNLAATQILDYAQAIKNAVRELQINGCSDTEISFENAIVAGYNNPNSPSDGSCNVFHPNGGGLTYISFDQLWGLQNFEMFGVAANLRAIKGIGTDTKSDLYYSIRHNEKSKLNAICERINELANVTRIGSDPANMFSPYTTGPVTLVAEKFTGSYNDGTMAPLFTTPTEIINKKFFCVRHSVYDGVGFYFPILER